MVEIAELASEKHDFVFNLVESINNKGEINYFIPALLNLYSIPYSGNPLEAIFVTTNKKLASNLLKNAGIRNPQAFLPSQSAMLTEGLQYILKPIWEDGSLGITAESVFTHNELSVERLNKLDDSHWFVEEYIEGREFNISVLTGKEGPEVLPPAEIIFNDFQERPRIMDFRAKWDIDSYEYVNTVRNFPGGKLGVDLERKLKDTAKSCWNLFGLKGYARVDVRVDNEENVYVIEINANPCMSPDSGFMAATIEAGFDFADVIRRILGDLNR